MVRARNDAQLERLMRFPAAQWMIFKGMARASRAAPMAFKGRWSTSSAAAGAKRAGICGSGHAEACGEGRASRESGPSVPHYAAVFARMAAGEINPAHAILERKLEVEGDIKTLARYSAMFEQT